MATLIRRIGAREKIYWAIQFHYRGKPYKISLGTITDTQAKAVRERTQRRLTEVKSGILQPPSDGSDLAEFFVRGRLVTQSTKTEENHNGPGPDFETVCDTYLKSEEARISRNYLSTKRIHLSNFSEFLGPRVRRPLSELKLSDIEDYANRRREEVAAKTVNDEISTFAHLFEYAIRHGYLAKNLAKEVPRFKEEGSLKKFRTLKEIQEEIARGGYSDSEANELYESCHLTGEEIQELLGICKEKDPWLYPLLATIAFTGIRRGEATRLEWQHVDFARRILRVGSRKQSTKKELVGRDIEMHEKLVAVLKEYLKTCKGRYVFHENGQPINPPDLHSRWGALVKGTKFDNLSGYHVLRHSFASNLAAQGVDQRIIDTFMGHQTEEMRKRYQHLFPERKNEAIHSLPY